jgi:hypothetical protein
MNPVSFFLGAHQASALHLERAIVVKVDLHELIDLEGISGVSAFSTGAVVETLSVVLFVCVYMYTYVCYNTTKHEARGDIFIFIFCKQVKNKIQLNKRKDR